MHRIETEHVRVVCENHQVEFLSNCHLFSWRREDAAPQPLLYRWVHLYMDTTRDTTQYPLCVRASSVTVISGMLVYMDTPKDATQYPLSARASSVTVISGMLVYDTHVVVLQTQIQCEVLSQAMEEGQCQGR